MVNNNLEEKRVFLIASPSPKKQSLISEKIKSHIASSVIFTSDTSADIYFKMDNSTPHVLILDAEIAVSDLSVYIDRILNTKKYQCISIIVLSPLPEKEQFTDAIVTGQVQFLPDFNIDAHFAFCLSRSLNRLTKDAHAEYRLLFIPPKTTLFCEGDPADAAYVVRLGELRATKKSGSDKLEIGRITTGEFVGEMAHINGAPRSATVETISDCELIEIPFGTLDHVLFTKPTWARALVATLSKRLNHVNKIIVDE